jgi:hypothetical protein
LKILFPCPNGRAIRIEGHAFGGALETEDDFLIEVLAPIAAPGTLTPQGAHTHFLPEFLQDGEEAPAGLALPDYALPVAIYYPTAAG